MSCIMFQEDSQVKDMELEIEKQHTVILNLKNENSGWVYAFFVQNLL